MTRYLMMAVVCSMALSACAQDQDTDTSEAALESSDGFSREPREEEHVIYYSDDSRRTRVGGYDVYCQGGGTWWGTESPYYRRWSEPCQPW